jgi:DNA adenine methylase/adenine-specific DNA-methyltransferase
MGSKNRLIPWIQTALSKIEFDTALDAFSGSGTVAYLLKSMGKETVTNDFLKFPSVIAKAVIENSDTRLDESDLSFLLAENSEKQSFIKDTFEGIFYTPNDLEFLDLISANLQEIKDLYKKALGYASLFRSCLKKQPRGVFTISGALEKYDDGRRDLRLSLEEHFVEQVQIYNDAVFSNGKKNKAFQGDIFDPNPDFRNIDLVYMDPPYVPKSDDNDYIKRYHFLEGLSSYWRNERIMENTKVKKIEKKYTPFSYRKSAIEAFDKMFENFQSSILVLSYSSNGYPDLETLVNLMSKYKATVNVHSRPHKYHFGTHANVNRSNVEEYLIIGQ